MHILHSLCRTWTVFIYYFAHVCLFLYGQKKIFYSVYTFSKNFYWTFWKKKRKTLKTKQTVGRFFNNNISSWFLVLSFSKSDNFFGGCFYMVKVFHKLTTINIIRVLNIHFMCTYISDKKINLYNLFKFIICFLFVFIYYKFN